MSIRSKITMFLSAGLFLVLAAMVIFNTVIQSRSISDLNFESAESLGWALSGQVGAFMISGENARVQPLAEEVVSRGLASEMTVIDAEKTVKRASDKAILDKLSDDPMWASVFQSGSDTTCRQIVNGVGHEVSYRLFKNSDDCVTCHDGKPGEILGGMKLVLSEEAMMATIERNETIAIVTGLLGLLIIVPTLVFQINRRIFKPLRSVQRKLDLAGQGDIEQNIIAKSDDEIGSLLKSIKGLIDYIRTFTSVSQKVAEGDLRVDVSPRSEKDALGRAYRQMLTNLAGIIRDLSDTAARLVEAAREIASTSESMSKGALDQADQITRVTAAAEEMNAILVETSQNTTTVTDISKQASETAVRGGSVVRETIDGMRRISGNVSKSADALGLLSGSAEKISDVIRVISDIADQTNLLALNAAIEAARAGEQGRGFAVVADEVRKLAEKTGKATSEITGMIKEIQTETSSAVETMQASVGEVVKGSELADTAGKSLDEIVQTFEQVSQMISQIANSSVEQSEAADVMTKDMEAISSVTRSNAAGAEQSAVTAELLSKQAKHLQEIVSRFQVNG